MIYDRKSPLQYRQTDRQTDTQNGLCPLSHNGVPAVVFFFCFYAAVLQPYIPD